MFGGVAFLVNGNMFCGVSEALLVIRLGTDGAAEALLQPNTREMDFTGKVIRSMVYVETGSLESDELRSWVERGLKFARSCRRNDVRKSDPSDETARIPSSAPAEWRATVA